MTYNYFRWLSALIFTTLFLISSLSAMIVPLSSGVEVNDVGNRVGGGQGISYFVENKGQVTDPDVLFYTEGQGNRIGFTDHGLIHCIKDRERSFVYHVEFLNCRSTVPGGVGKLDSVSNYFLGNDPAGWITGVDHFKELYYEDLYPRIDLRFYLVDSSPKYDLIVKPGGDIEDIKIRHIGVESRIRDSRIVIDTPVGKVIEEKPVSSLLNGPVVPSEWRQVGDGIYSISVGIYDNDRTLVIDPYIYYSTLLGGNSYDDPVSAMDEDGYVYTTGSTSSADFPTSLGCYDDTSSNSDSFLTKFDKKGDRFLFSTYIGGGESEYAKGIVLDDEGDIYISGRTRSSDFPTTKGVFQEDHQGFVDVFALKISNGGDKLIHSTYIGAYSDRTYEQEDGGTIDIDDDGYVYVGGMTGNPDFPFTEGAYSTDTYGDRDFFIMKLNVSFDKVIFCTSVGGYYNDYLLFIKVLDDGSVVAAGETFSSDFPTTSGAYDRSHNGQFDAIVVRISKTGGSLLDSTFIGGNGNDHAYGFDVDPDGDILITGDTVSSNYPTTNNAFDRSVSARDSFLTVLNSSFSSIDYSTYLGGKGDETGWAVIHLVGEEVLAGGYTRSSDYSTVNSWFNDSLNGESDGYIVKVNISNGSLVMSGLIGGSGGDGVYDIDIDEGGKYLAISGKTWSSDFPLTKNNVDDVYDPSRGDIFLMKCLLNDPISPPGNISVDPGDRFLNVSWDPPELLMGEPLISYSLYFGLNKDNLSFMYEIPPDHMSFNLTGLVNGRRYYVSLAGCVWFDQGPMSDVMEGTPSTIPQSPENLTLSTGDGLVGIRWERPDSDGGSPLTKYMVYRSVGGEPDSLIGEVLPDSDHLRDHEAENGKNYGYRVSAVNGNGEGMSTGVEYILVGDVPSSPVNVSATPTGTLEVTVTWDRPHSDFNLSVREYIVHRSEPGQGHIPLSRVSGTRYVDVGLEMGTTYRYSVSAINIKGEGARSEADSAEAMVYPGAVRDLEYDERNGSVFLSWGPPRSDGGGDIINYGVLRSSGEGSMELINTTVETSYSDSDLINGEIYLYSIRAFNELGGGNESLAVAATPYTFPEKVGNLDFRRGDSKVFLSWDEPAFDGGREVTGYLIEYQVMGDDQVMTKNAGTNSAEIENLYPGGIYKFSVSAVNQRGTGPYSDIIEITVITYPERPSSVEEISVGDGNVTLGWSEPEFDGGCGITGYKILRNGMEIASVDDETTRFTDSDLVNGVEYSYMVLAFNQLGSGEPTDNITSVPRTVPGPPSDLRIQRIDGGFHLTWDRPSENGGSPTTGYRIYRSADRTDMIGEVSDLDFLDDDPEPNVEYTYRVKSLNSMGEGPPSEEVSAVFHLVPEPVTDLKVALNGYDVVVSWDEPVFDGGTEITGYRVYRKIDGQEMLVGEVGPDELEFVDGSASAGRKYGYSVSAVNNAGESAREDPVTVSIDNKTDYGSLLVPTIILILLGLIAILALLFFILRSGGEEEPTEIETDQTPSIPDQVPGLIKPPQNQNSMQRPVTNRFDERVDHPPQKSIKQNIRPMENQPAYPQPEVKTTGVGDEMKVDGISPPEPVEQPVPPEQNIIADTEGGGSLDDGIPEDEGVEE